MVQMLHVMHSDQFQVLDHRQICENVLNKKKIENQIFCQLKIYSLLVSALLVAPDDVVAQFTLISLPITKRLFIASNAFAAA